MVKCNFYLLLFLLAMPLLNNAQNGVGCGFIAAQEMASKQYNEYDRKLKLVENFQNQNYQRSATTTVTIPVVFHVLHQGGAENITDAQIQSAVAILTRDFRKKNSDTTNIVVPYKNLAADVNVEFKLANKDPDGKCTNGITRHFDEKTNWVMDLNNYTYTWPNDKYMNVYVVNSMPNAAGYTFLPGTVPVSADAIVILHNYVGEIGTSSAYTSRALTHEVGHWLGLSHVWGNTNNPGVACGDDGVSDTPITKGHGFCNLASPIDCTPGVPENIQNYMEYAFCSNMFTIGQSNLMNGIMGSSIANRNNVVSAANMVATGIINPNYNCAPKPDFKAVDHITCQNGTLVFYDQSYNGNVNNWWWSSPAAQSTSTLQNGSLTFVNSGLVPVKLKVSNTFGSDSLSKPNFVTVLSNTGATINVSEGFENAVFPNSNWIASVPQYGGSFIQSQTTGASGVKSLYVNNYTDNPNEPVYLYSPRFNLNNVTGAQLTFKYAYAQQNANDDRLRVFVNTDCGSTWNLIYDKSGNTLATSSPVNSSAFTPTLGDWRSESVSLSGYQGNSNVFLKFEFTSDITGSGNNLYLDDINLTGTVGLKENSTAGSTIRLFPNPASETAFISSQNNVITAIELTDITGKKLIAEENLSAKAYSVHLNDLSAGVYVIKISCGSYYEYKKLVVE